MCFVSHEKWVQRERYPNNTRLHFVDIYCHVFATCDWCSFKFCTTVWFSLQSLICLYWVLSSDHSLNLSFWWRLYVRWWSHNFVYKGWWSFVGLRSSVGESVPRYFRTLTVSNNSRQSVLLLDICGIPSVNHIFVLHDDYGLAHHNHQVSHNPRNYDDFEGSKGVLLQTNAQYQVTVVCNM